MRFKLTLLLLLANTLVFYFIWSLGRPDETPGTPIFPWLQTATAITVEGKEMPNPRRMELQRDGQWKITSPIEWQANSHAVKALLAQLQALSKEINFSVKQIEESGRSLADYGLSEPILTLTVVADSTPYVLKVGALTQIGNRVYLLSPDGNHIIAAPQELLQLLSLDIEQLRSKRVFSIRPFEIRGLSIRTSSGDVANTESGLAGQRFGVVKADNAWRIETPIRARADTKAVEALLAELTGLEANRFVMANDASPAAYGLNTPSLRVSLEGNSRETLLLGRRVSQTKIPQFYAQIEGNPAIFTVDAAPFENLERAQELLRDRQVLSFDPQQLNALEIQGPDGKADVRLQRLENGAWQVLAEGDSSRIDPTQADAERLSQLVQGLQELRAVHFVTDAPTAENLKSYGLDKPVRTVLLSMDNSGTPLSLSLGAAANGESKDLFAKTSGSNTVYQVHPAILKLLSSDPLYYRSRILAGLPESAVIGNCTLTDLSNGKVIIEGNPAQLPDNLSDKKKGAFSWLAQALRRFQVDAYLSTDFSKEGCFFEGKTIPWRYRLTAEVSLPAGAEQAKTQIISYDFTGRQGGTVQLGGSPQAKMTFLLTQTMIDALFALTDTPPPIPENPEGRP